MAKVLGAVLTILGGLSTLFILFLYLNTSAVLNYNPSVENIGVLETGLLLPGIFAVLTLLSGIVLSKVSTEPSLN